MTRASRRYMWGLTRVTYLEVEEEGIEFIYLPELKWLRDEPIPLAAGDVILGWMQEYVEADYIGNLLLQAGLGDRDAQAMLEKLFAYVRERHPELWEDEQEESQGGEEVEVELEVEVT